MTVRSLAIIACGLMTACAPNVPDSNPEAGAGVGFGDYERYQGERERREAELSAQSRGSAVPEGPAIASETVAVLNTTRPAGSAPVAQETVTTTQIASGEPLDATGIGNAEISDEQSFDAVASRETIESDRERLARQSQEYQIAAPEALPERSGDSGPNIVVYALNTTNRLGQPVHKRSGKFNQDKFTRACAAYASPDLAQEAFLKAGGPERDRKGMDPDGDGFACFSDRTPFRTARGG